MLAQFLLDDFTRYAPVSSFQESLIVKCCKGRRVADLLLHMPHSYIFRERHPTKQDGYVTLLLTVQEHYPPLKYSKTPYKVFATNHDQSLTVEIVFFNANSHYIRSKLPIDQMLCVSGVYKVISKTQMQTHIQMTHPDTITQTQNMKFFLGFEAIYPLTAKLNNKTLSYVIHSLVNKIPESHEWLSTELITQYNLPTLSEAFRYIHIPTSSDQANAIFSKTSPAHMRLACDEILVYQKKMLHLREKFQNVSESSFPTSNTLKEQFALPFPLTEDQKKAIHEIEQDLASQNKMNRLLQADVGSGKTIVAFITSLSVIENGGQVAFLAPSEILALQHFENIQNWCSSLNISCDLIVGNNRRARDKQIKNLNNGMTQIVIGTHALLEEKIAFHNLGMVVVDEQHKFGVSQRERLLNKGNAVNALFLSATPIPRTILMSVYADLNVSVIKTRPAHRKEIITALVHKDRIDEVLEKISRYQHSVFWVCPLVNERELENTSQEQQLILTPTPSLTNVYERCEYINAFFKQRYANQLSNTEDIAQVIHGNMRAAEKTQITEKFRQQAFKILVATTVIEVGVDIPHANLIVIEHAERFGLAQLHQLRGRVGRGSEQGICILMPTSNMTQIAQERLRILKQSTDGFFLSEEDLKLRGGGNILGNEQTGFVSFKCAQNYLHMSQALQKHPLSAEDEELLTQLFSIYTTY